MTISSSDMEPPRWEQVVAWETLWRAWQRAARGKRGLRAAAAFEWGLADRLLRLQRALETGAYRPGGYHSFFLHEGKRRKISAAPFRDRVVHHALCGVIEPGWEARFHPHSYANRVGRGTHRAIDQAQAWARRYRYVLRVDVVRHFPSLDHAILQGILDPYLPDERLRALVAQILASGAGVLDDAYEMVYFAGDDLLALLRPRGLPIGNLTSQFWSNCYLNGLDWWVTRSLRCPAYLRYVDDFALFSDSKRELWGWKRALRERLASLRLTMHEDAAQVLPTRAGIPWLGWVLYPTHRRLKRRNVIHFRRRLTRNLALYEAGAISFAELDASVQGWINHVRHGNTWGLRGHLFHAHPLPTPRKNSSDR